MVSLPDTIRHRTPNKCQMIDPLSTPIFSRGTTKQIADSMVEKAHQRPLMSCLRPTSPNDQYKYNIAGRSGQQKPSNNFPNAALTRVVAPTIPWTVYQWRSAAQQYYQHACQLQKENEAWKTHYQKLYRVHLETLKALERAEEDRDQARKLARKIAALRFGIESM